MTHHMPMQTPHDLFVHELSDIYSAEQIILQMLGEAQSLVQDSQIVQGLQQHERETQQHLQHLDQAFRELGAQRHPVTCHAVEGLHRELQEVQQSNPSPEVLQGVVVGGAAKTEHYEIAAYTGLVTKARAMGQTRVADLLQLNLAQEQKMLQQVERLDQQLTQRMTAQMPAAGTDAQSTTPL